jgi:hypothetical protein
MGRLLQPVALGGGQHDRSGGGNGHGGQADHEKWIITVRRLPYPGRPREQCPSGGTGQN